MEEIAGTNRMQNNTPTAPPDAEFFLLATFREQSRQISYKFQSKLFFGSIGHALKAIISMIELTEGFA